MPDGEKTLYPLGTPKAVFCVELQRSGKLVTLALCNIRGLWMGEKRVEVV